MTKELLVPYQESGNSCGVAKQNIKVMVKGGFGAASWGKTVYLGTE